MSDTVKHSDDEEIVTLTYTWGQVKNFLHEHGRPATTRNAEALVAACGRGNRIENGMDSLQRRVRRGRGATVRGVDGRPARQAMVRPAEREMGIRP